jgi:hypothetical protein
MVLTVPDAKRACHSLERIAEVPMQPKLEQMALAHGVGLPWTKYNSEFCIPGM